MQPNLLIRTLKSAGVLILLALLVPLTACDQGSQTLRMHIPSHQQFDPEALQGILIEQSSLRAVQAAPAQHLSPLEALLANEADLVLLENSTAFVPGIRAVLPVYESVLHVLVRQDFAPEDPNQPLRGASFFVAGQSEAGHAFVELITRRQGLKPAEYRKVLATEPDAADMIIYFGPIDPESTTWYQPGYDLVSPGERFNPGGGFYEERAGYIAPQMKPTIIPAFTYDLPGNKKPLLTVAVDTLLVARKDMPEATVFELTRTLLEQKPRFTAIAPYLFSGVNESFDPLNLSFPLHDGARRYLDRDEPSLLERYAESINMLVYLAFLLMTAFLALARWRARRKEDRIDIFYEQVLAVRDRIGVEEPSVLLQELTDLERQAFDSLVNGRLAANESFRIFTDLLYRARADCS